MQVTKAIKKSAAAAAKLVTTVESVKAPKATKAAKAVKPVPTAKPTLAVVKPDVPAGPKLCKRCGLIKDLSEFASDRSSKDLHYSICKADEKLDRERKKAASTLAPIAPVQPEKATKKAAKK